MFLKTEKDLENLGFGEEVHILEYIYLLEKRILENGKEDLKDLWKRAKEDKLAKEKYEIIKYLRENKYIVRFSKDSEYIRIYQKGIRIGEDRTEYLMRVVKKLQDVEVKDLRMAKDMRKKLIISVYDKKNKIPLFFRIDQIQFE